MTNEPHDHSGQDWYGGPDAYGDGRTAQPYGWGGESDADATAFVQLPPGGLPGDWPDPLAAPGTGQGGWEPPRIDPAAADAGAPGGAPMTPAAGIDPASTGQWTMPFAAQPHPETQLSPEPHHPHFDPQQQPQAPEAPDAAGGTGGAMSRGPAAALGQGAAAALAGSHEARTHRRPLGAGGAAAAGDTATAGQAQHGSRTEEWPQPAPSSSWRADQDAMLADALARRQVPLPGGGVPQQAADWEAHGQQSGHTYPDASRIGGDAHPWPAEPTPYGPGGQPADADTGRAWHPDEQPAPGPAGTPPHGFPSVPPAPSGNGGYENAAPHAPAVGTPYGSEPGARPDPVPYPAEQGGPEPGDHGAPEPVASYDAWAGETAPPGNAGQPAEAGQSDGPDRQPAPEPAEEPGAALPHPAGPGEPEPAEAAESAGPAERGPAGADGDVEEPSSGTETTEAPAVAEGDGDPVPPAAAPEAPEAHPAEEAPDLPATVSDHPHISYLLHVNGADRPVSDAWIGESLLYVLRERLGLAGAKDGCSQGECGACSVQMDGRLVAACLVPAATAVGTEIRTVEGLAGDDGPSDVQRALAGSGAVQCGFCVPGIAMAVHDLLEGNHAPTELETRQALCGNLCRCSGYRGVLDAVQHVAAERADRAAREAAEAEAAQAAQQAGGAPAPGAGREAPRIPQQAQYGGGEGTR